MKFPPRDAYRIRPPFEVPADKPHRLIASAIFAAGFAIAVLGAFHEVHSTGKEPTTHLQPYSPLPTAGSFQVLGNPALQPTQEASPSPTAALQLHQREVVPTPAAPLYAPNQGNPSPVQVWSSANVLTPAGPEAVAAAVAAPAAADPLATAIATPTPTPESLSTPTPSPQPSASPTSTPRPSPTPTPQPSTTPTPQPSPSGSPSCVPTRRHPCPPRGENRT